MTTIREQLINARRVAKAAIEIIDAGGDVQHVRETLAQAIKS